jgi:iron complex outermembrane receptor protein
MNRRGGLLAGVATIGAVLVSTGAAHAADSAVGGDVAQVDEIVVTARRRAENLQNVPDSIIAIGQGEIRALNAKSLVDLNRVTPNAHISDNGQVTIRGIASNTRNIGFEAGAAVYIDGVYQGRPAGNNQDLADVERVEVLRGPQGTLYGKNTTAGAISLVTVRPGDTFTGRVEGQYGERNDRRLSGYVAGPLIQGLLGFKLSGYAHATDGYERNITNGDRYGDVDVMGGRAELRLTPGDWDLALRGDYTRDNSVPYVAKAVAGFAAPFAPGIKNIAQDAPSRSHLSSGGASFTAERTFEPGYTVTSISAWRTQDIRQTGDDDYSPLDIWSHDFHDESKQLSEELRLSSPTGRRLRYIVGLYAYSQDLKSNRPGFPGRDFGLQGTLDDISSVDTRSIALFSSVDYDLTSALTANLGLRFTHEHKSLDFVQVGLPAVGFPNLLIHDAFTNTDLSPTASLTYKISPDLTVYGKVSRGFKSGGWNPDITTTPDIGFGAEKVTNFETGLRSELFDRRLKLNVTAYYMKWRDMQVQQFLGTFVGNVVTNAGEATIRGAELDLTAKPASWLSITAGGALNDTRFDKFDSGKGVSYAGQQFLYTPRLSGFVAFDASWPVREYGNFVVQGDFSGQSRVYFDNDRTVSVVGPYASAPYGLANMRVGFVARNGLEVFVFGDNLTDKRVLLDRISDGLGLGLVTDRYGPPREFGVRVGYSF